MHTHVHVCPITNIYVSVAIAIPMQCVDRLACAWLICTANPVINSGVARPGPNRACALPSTSQTLSSPGQQDSHDFSMNTKKQTYTHTWFRILQQC